MNGPPPHVIAADHPMLAGHFPGDPIVPGAYLLAWVLARATAWLAARGDPRCACGVARVKFLRPLRPDEAFECDLTLGAASLQFTVIIDAGTIATGALMLRETATP